MLAINGYLQTSPSKQGRRRYQYALSNLPPIPPSQYAQMVQFQRNWLLSARPIWSWKNSNRHSLLASVQQKHIVLKNLKVPSKIRFVVMVASLETVLPHHKDERALCTTHRALFIGNVSTTPDTIRDDNHLVKEQRGSTRMQIPLHKNGNVSSTRHTI